MDLQSEKDPTGEAAAILASLDFELPEFDVVSVQYQLLLAAAACFLLFQWGFLLALLGALLWLLLHAATASGGSLPAFAMLVVMDLGVVIFILKPLVLRPTKKTAPRTERLLTREDEPLLYAFVEKLCHRLGAPVPRNIHVSIQANAAAAMTNLVTGRVDLELGLPLFAVFPLRTFTAILAHEFGHFRQRYGLRASCLVYRSGHAFARVLYQRDKVDAYVVKLQQSRKLIPKIIGWVVWLAVECTRGLLWLIMIMGYWLACRLRHQMEFDADRLGARIAGRTEMCRTLEVLEVLGVGTQHAMGDAGAALFDRALPDDMVQLIVADAISMARYRDKIFSAARTELTRWDSTHPSLTDREANIEHIDDAGVMRGEVRSTRLISNFFEVCHGASRAFYDAQFGDMRKRIAVIGAKKLADARIERRAGKFRVQRYFRTSVGLTRRILPDQGMLAAPADSRKVVTQLEDARRSVLALADKLDRSTGDDYEDLIQARTALRANIRAMDAFIAAILRAYPHARIPALLRLRRRMTRDAEKIQDKLSALQEVIDTLDRISQRRLAFCFSLLLCAPPGQNTNHMATLQQRAAVLLRRCRAFEPIIGLATQIRERTLTSDILTGSYPAFMRPILAEQVREATAASAADIAEFQREFGHRPEHREIIDQQAALGRVLPPPVTQSDNLREVRRTAVGIYNYCLPVLEEMQAQTAILAEDIELAWGLEALAESQDETPERVAEVKRKISKGERRYWMLNGLRAAGGILLLILIAVLSRGHTPGGRAPVPSASYKPVRKAQMPITASHAPALNRALALQEITQRDSRQ